MATQPNRNEARRYHDRRRRQGNGGVAPDSRLRERDDVLGELEGVLSGEWHHPTGAIVVEGVPGLGKTAIVNSACHLAAGFGLRVLRARGADGETGAPYGVARQLLEPLLGHRGGTTPVPSPGSEVAAKLLSARLPGRDPIEVFHAFNTLLAHDAVGPVLLAVDDVHWADPESAAWLHFLARRLPCHDLCLVVSTRPRRAGVPLAAADRLISEPSARTLTLQPLSSGAVADLITDELGHRPEPGVTGAVHEATGGNPFLVVALLKELAALPPRPPAQVMAELPHLASPAVAHSALARLSPLGEGALPLLEAVAVLDPHADLRVAGALAGVEGDAAGMIADGLAAVGLLRSGRPLAFLHALVRASVYAEIPPARRSQAHRQAAALLAGGADLDVVARHLLATEPAGDPSVVSDLIPAARAALEDDDVERATRYVRRALAEPPAEEQRAQVLLVQAELEGHRRQPEGLAHLEHASALGVDRVAWARTGLDLVERFWDTPHAATIVDLLRSVQDELAEHDPEAHLRLLLSQALVSPATTRLRSVADCVAPLDAVPATAVTLAGRLTAVTRALGAIARPARSTRDEVVEVIVGALAGDVARAAPGALAMSVMTQALTVLVRAGRVDAADPLLEAAKEAADREGRTDDSAAWSLVLAESRCAQGRLAEAQVLVDAAVAATRDAPRPAHDRALLARTELLVLHGDAEEALATIQEVAVEHWRPAGLFEASRALEVRGRAHLLAERWDDARRDFDAAATLANRQGISNPALTGWRAGRCAALAALGRRHEAVAVAEENLAAARCWGPPILSEALRLRAQVASSAARIELLSEALAGLQDTPWELERCRVLIELGRARRAADDLMDARKLLRPAADLAVRIGAVSLARVAGAELRAAGARPRRLQLSGTDALTPSERRVVLLAAQGCTNQMIASSLFVSLKTVESHLARSYRKLGITSRAQLADLLPDDAELA